MTNKLILFFLVILLGITGFSQNTRKITLDVNQVKGKHSEVFKECIGAGRANEGLRADWQHQLKTLQDEIGFNYIRFHGLLSDDMGVYREDKNGVPEYNYQYIDALFDYLLSVNIRPFVELGFMPNDLTTGTKTIFWWKGNISPPKSYEKWGALIKNLVMHFEQRYGRDEVKKWYFEVWNEPDLKLFFDGTLEEYLHLYDVSAKAIKSVCNEYKVGGPASAMAYKYETELVKHCFENNIPIDFVSTHSYGVKSGYLDENGKKGVVIDTSKNSISGRMVRSRELIKQSKLPDLALHFTEWSSSYTPTDPIHDSYHSAALILDKIKTAESSVNSMSYWVFTDIFEEHGPRFTPFHGGFGLFNYQSVKKPAYFAFQYLVQLGKTELVNTDKASWACKDEKGGIQILYWDFTPIGPPDSTNDQVFFKRDLPSKPMGDVTVSLRNVPDGKYELQVCQIGYRVNDVYALYMDMGSPSQLTLGQVAEMKQKCSGAPISVEIVKIKNGQFEKSLRIRENDVFVLKLNKI